MAGDQGQSCDYERGGSRHFTKLLLIDDLGAKIEQSLVKGRWGDEARITLAREDRSYLSHTDVKHHHSVCGVLIKKMMNDR